MSITVGELLRLPHLRMELLAGSDGLGREISWVHTSDLAEPWDWLGFGELLLTNGTGLRPDEDGQAHFVDRLAAAGASGLGLGLGMSGPPITTAVYERAEAHKLPVVTVPYSIPFTTVVRAVAEANAGEESRQLGRVARLYELLRTSVLSERSGPDLFRRLGSELGARLYLVDPETGVSVFGDGKRTAFADCLAASYLANGNAVPGLLRLAKPGAAAGDATAVAVAVPSEHPAVLVAEPVGRQPLSLVMLQHLATGGALQITQLAAAQKRQHRLGEQLLRQLLDRRIGPEAAEPQLAELGVDLTASLLAVVQPAPPSAKAAGLSPRPVPGPATAGPGPSGPGRSGPSTSPPGTSVPGRPAPDARQAATADPGLHHKLARARVPHLLLQRDGLCHLVLPEEVVASGSVPALWAGTQAVGASGRIGGAGRVPDAAAEARWALAVADAEHRPLVRYGEETALLLPRSPAEAQALVTRILGPLMEHDRDHGTVYLDTLRAVLEHDRSWQFAAGALHIHKQTLGYRIRKIERLTGRGVTRTEHVAEWWFALRAHDLITGRLPTR